MTMNSINEAAFRQHLLTSPSEGQHVEYKAAIPFDTESDFGLKLVKHVLGMANTGGGWIVIGFEDGPPPRVDPEHSKEVTATYEATKVSQAVNQHVARGQQVRLHVYNETHPATSLRHPVIHVEGFERLPFICRSTKGGVLTEGDVYIRRSTAETTKVNTPQDWEELISRCVSLRRDEFLSQFTDVFHRMTVGDPTPPEDADTRLMKWLKSQRELSVIHKQLGYGHGYMESAQMLIIPRSPGWSNQELKQAISNHDTGWPQFESPQSLHDGIAIRVPLDSNPRLAGDRVLNKDGSGYFSNSLLEDYWQPNFTSSLGHPDKTLWYDRTIVRIAQMHIESAVLYGALGVDPSERYVLSIHYGGLQGRTLYAFHAGNPWITGSRLTCEEDVHQSQLVVTQDQVKGQLIDLTHQLVSSLFELFEFASVPRGTVAALISRYILQ